MKLALITLGWNPNPGPNIVSRKAFYTVDGGPANSIEATGVDSVEVKIRASSSVLFWTEVTDDDGETYVSESHAFSIGDGVTVQPDTGLFHINNGFIEEDVPPVPVDDI